MPVDEQPVRETRCPECGGDPTEDSVMRHALSEVGYLHDDQTWECLDCGHVYSHGVPVGEADIEAGDLWCDVCDIGWLTVHRVEKQQKGVKLHLKCSHHYGFECPECGLDNEPDGVRVTKTGSFICQRSGCVLDRADIPYCFYFRFAHRRTDEGHRALVGYPTITGEVATASENYGYPADEDPTVARGEAAKPAIPDDWNPIDYYQVAYGKHPPETLPPCGEPGCAWHGDGTLGCPVTRTD